MNNFNRFLEAELLHPRMNGNEVETFIQEAIQNLVISCLIPSFWVKKVARELQESGVQVSAYVGYPFGFQDTATKAFEAKEAIRQGADEIDLVWSQTAFHSGMNWPKIEIAQLSKICHEEGKLLKVTIEAAFLSDQQLQEACLICQDAGADFIKTTTGIYTQKTNTHQLVKMRSVLSSNVGLIAAGSADLEESLLLIKAGADRVCTASAFLQLKNWRSKTA
ncbi:MAG: deoxyribose-phosphate aldolase [Algoriphagus sp.]|jgi:deoxyribose-phosphate aldolase